MPQPILDHWQYRIAPGAPAGPAGAPADGIDVGGGFRLEAGPGLPVVAVEDAAGATVGHLLGFPVDLAAASLPEGRWRAPGGASGPGVVRALGGRFLYVAHGPRGPVIHPDALAQVPCVYDPDARLVGCSAHALYDDAEYEARIDRPFLDAIGLVGEGWIPGGLTAHAGLRRLYPGHALDLGDWSVRRVWQGPEDAPGTDDLVEEFITLARAQLRALAEGPRRIALALTAGVDSRSVLAMARDFAGGLDCVTVVAGDRHATDSVVARRIARGEGLSHRELQRRTATPAEQALFLRRNGHCNGDSNRLYHPSVRPLAEGHVFVGGIGGEIARGPFWAPSDGPGTRVSGAEMTARFGLPQVPRLVEALDARFATLPDVDGLRRLELIFIEDRMAAWSSVQFPSDPTLIRHAPMVTIRGLELMLAQPTEWKRAGRLPHEIIRRAWPELARYPVNTLGRGMDAWVNLRRAIREPYLVAKKLRKLRA